MSPQRFLSPEDLQPWSTGAGLGDLAKALLRQQQETWPLLRRGYESLKAVQSRSFSFDDAVIRVDFNPGRLTSTAAKVDDKSIKERKCFLCINNLPTEQRGIAYGDGYVILCNPFPIFPEHLT